MNKKQSYDVVIIGAGPAGLNAALYASRANLKVAIIEKYMPGGKISQTAKVENWLGSTTIDGFELANQMFKHAMSFGTEYISGNVINIKHINDLEQQVILEDKSTIEAKTVIIATGMKNREPIFIKNYQNFVNKGVSFCAVCDGPLFKDKPVLVLGSGNSAFEEATYLSNFVSHVTLITKDQNFSAEKKIVDDFLVKKNITLLDGAKILELQGSDFLEKALIEDKNNKKIELQVSALFPFIGLVPVADFAKDFAIFDQKGFIVTNEEMETKVPGIFAIGDIRQKEIRQIVTAANDGAIAAKKISDKLNTKK
ncbi:NAD(P)/FAD-dependent oxidoreductase [Mycoplasmopsis hyopharyngis]|uniref:NAD(P)/FAD-dependent oxidoreductase n=1 Tax=Mycoplasmopsis hyopharyngis TaxID=29558 RepID=UPI003872B01E